MFGKKKDLKKSKKAQEARNDEAYDYEEYEAYEENEAYEDALPEYAEDYYEEYEEYEDYDEGYYDEEEPQKTLAGTVAYTLVVLLFAIGLALVAWLAADDVLALTKPDNVITIVVDEGDSLDVVAQNLRDHGLINFKFLFVIYGRFSHAEDKISSGTFELNQQFDYHALVNGLSAASDSRQTITLTFPEGYTCRQIFEVLAENGVCTLEELEEVAANYEFDYDFLADRPYGDKYRLEGYLFPDTYDFYMDDSPESVISRFLRNFSGRVTEDMLSAIDQRNEDIRERMEAEGSFTEAEIENAMLDVYKLLTVASLIEREAGNDQERSTISSVIYNRLTTRVHELLQIDATVEYALGEHKTELTANDLAIDNPYNTYKYTGLPPGPIANPGLASIVAALYPKDTEYFFYALDGNGHQFFENYMEQQAFLNGETLPEADDTEDTMAPVEEPEDTEDTEDTEEPTEETEADGTEEPDDGA